MNTSQPTIQQTLTQKCANVSLGLVLLAEPELLSDSEIMVIVASLPKTDRETAGKLLQEYYNEKAFTIH